jgi:hypothetical protein
MELRGPVPGRRRTLRRRATRRVPRPPAADPDTAKSQPVMKAMMQMKKLDIAGLKRAVEQP